jgi:hypothetical protein
LNIGIAFLLADDPFKSLIHLQSSWDYKTGFGLPDLLTARLLLARLAASFVINENNELFIRQLNTLLAEDKLTASGINAKWSLEKPLKLMMAGIKEEYNFLWNLSCRAVNSKISLDSIVDLNILTNIGKGSLNEKWPDTKF